jgi:hypothetical protein
MPGRPTGEHVSRSRTLVVAAAEVGVSVAAGVAGTAPGLSNGVGRIQADYPAFPADAWVCNPDAST